MADKDTPPLQQIVVSYSQRVLYVIKRPEVKVKAGFGLVVSMQHHTIRRKTGKTFSNDVERRT